MRLPAASNSSTGGAGAQHCAVGGVVVACRFAGLERAGAMDDPDVILRVDRHADRLAEHPFVRQRLRPQRIDFEVRRLDDGRGRFDRRAAVERARRGSHTDQDRDEQRADTNAAVHERSYG